MVTIATGIIVIIVIIHSTDAIEITTVMVTQTGSEALNGVFTLSFNGHVTPAMPHDIPVQRVSCLF